MTLSAFVLLLAVGGVFGYLTDAPPSGTSGKTAARGGVIGGLILFAVLLIFFHDYLIVFALAILALAIGAVVGAALHRRSSKRSA